MADCAPPSRIGDAADPAHQTKTERRHPGLAVVRVATERRTVGVCWPELFVVGA